MENFQRLGAMLALIMMLVATEGCEPPPAVPAVAPGDDLRRSLMPEESTPEALGEQGNVKPTVAADLVPAPPTEPGETRKTASGVEYQTIKPGTGETARAGQKVTVHYVGTLDDGRKFDSSRDSGKPFSTAIGLTQVIKGWDEAVPGMKVGEVRKLTVPPAAGYGAQGKGNIPANATLHFEIELLKVENP